MISSEDFQNIKEKFLEWIGIKTRLDIKDPKPPYVKEGEVWWCYLGKNVGIEIDGKGEKFTRPAIIYKKLGRLGFLIIPLTTKQKEGSWYVYFTFKNKKQVAVLSQVRVISYKRLKEKMGQLDEKDMRKVEEGFTNLYMRKS